MTTGTTPKGYPYPNGDDPIINGDNMIKALAEKIDTQVPAMATGIATNPGAAAGSVGTVAVTFPAGRFSAAPQVFCQLANVNYGANPAFAWPSAITATGFTLNLLRNGAATSSTPIPWFAALT